MWEWAPFPFTDPPRAVDHNGTRLLPVLRFLPSPLCASVSPCEFLPFFSIRLSTRDRIGSLFRKGGIAGLSLETLGYRCFEHH